MALHVQGEAGRPGLLAGACSRCKLLAGQLRLLNGAHQPARRYIHTQAHMNRAGSRRAGQG